MMVAVFADYDICPKFWTSGQRAKLNHRSKSAVPLVWKLQPYHWQTMFHYKNWPGYGPGASGDCVHVISAGHRDATAVATAGEWGTSPCEARHCVVCEFPINHVK